MLIYLLKSGACLAIFMAFYTFFLEKENMHVFKRYYLLGALIIAFGIPLVTFTHYIEVTPLPIVNSGSSGPVVDDIEAVVISSETNYLPIILWSIYGVGVFLFGAKFLMNLLHIIFRIKRNPKQKSEHNVHVLLSDFIAPHTFFKYIFLNKLKYEQHEIPQAVFWHEETHANQKHSIDVLFVELLQVVFWFNPLIYFAKHSIKMNHEFLADQAVLNKGINASTYQYILLAFSSPDSYQDASEFQLANAINYPSTRHAIGMIKKRFTVMKTHTSKQKIWLRSVVLLPLLALSLYSFSQKNEVVKFPATQNSSSDPIKDIRIYIDANENITLNENPIKFEDLETEINKLNPNLSKEQKQNFVSATIHYEDDKSIGLTKKITPVLLKTGFSSSNSSNVNNLKRLGLPIKPSYNKYNGKNLEEANAIFDEEIIDLSPPKPMDPNSPWQLGFEVTEIFHEEIDKKPVVVTSDMITEYNSIAKSINAQPEATRTAKLKDFNRLSEIYGHMSAEQKQVSEPYPSLPKYEIIENIQQKATPEEITEYNKLAKQINTQNPNNTIVRQQDVDRLKFLYGKMSKEQKENSETFPNFPPPSLKEKVVIGYGTINSTGVNEKTQSSPKNANEPLIVEGYSAKDTSATNNIKDQSKNAEFVMINGKKPTNDALIMTRAELIAAKLTINGGEIVSFNVKIPGKPTQNIKGNVMNAETKALIKEVFEKDAIQIFMIKNSKNQAHPSIKILIKE